MSFLNYESKDSSLGSSIFGIALFVVLVIPMALVQGFTMMTLWNWFMPEVWDSAPLMTIWPATGVFLLVRYVIGMSTTHNIDNDTSFLEDTVNSTFFVLILSAIFLAEGYVLYLLIT